VNGTPSYRKVRLGNPGAKVHRDSGGRIFMRSPDALAGYPARLTERLVKWAAECPDRTFVAKRDGSGQWRRVSYAQALAAARRIGQALLDRGLSPERPLVILSENDLEHAMLALAALHVGIPYAPVSPAYSLISQDHERLRFIVGLLMPGLVFVSHGQKYEKAIRAAVPSDAELVVAEAAPTDRPSTSFRDFAATPATRQVDAAHAAVGPDTIAKFLFTSGSTQQPKAVINTHRMLCSNQQMLVQCMPFMAEEPPVLRPDATQASQAEIVLDPGVRAFFACLIEELGTQSTGSASRVTRALLLGDPPSIDIGEVTDKGSINQRAVLKARSALVEELYSAAYPDRVMLVRAADAR